MSGWMFGTISALVVDRGVTRSTQTEAGIDGC